MIGAGPMVRASDDETVAMPAPVAQYYLSADVRGCPRWDPPSFPLGSAM